MVLESGDAGALIGEARAEVRPLTADERALFGHLRDLRRRIEEERGAPPYVVICDAMLRETARERPRSTGAMPEIKGIGRRKVQAFGRAFLEALAVGSSVEPRQD